MQILGADPAIQVVGHAADGEEALAAVQRLRPDLITMDINMPRMDGLAATREIMHRFPTPIVLVTGNEITSEVRESFESLDSGALAILPRPHGPLHPGFDTETRHIVETVKLMAEIKVVRRWQRSFAIPRSAPPLEGFAIRAGVRPQVAILGASTGGPSALKDILRALPPEFDVPMILIQHIAQGFVDGFAGWLRDATGRQVRLAAAGEDLQPGLVFVPPENRQLGFSERGRIQLELCRGNNELCPSASYTFKSAANTFRARAIGVLLTGMGHDGADGLLALRKTGALTIAQDRTSSVVFGMPGEAVRLNAAELVLPIEKIAAALAATVNS